MIFVKRQMQSGKILCFGVVERYKENTVTIVPCTEGVLQEIEDQEKNSYK